MEGNSVHINSFLTLRESCITVDVRTPDEFNRGHIPGAVNIPLFTNEERALVGTKYVKNGRYNAVVAGLDAVGPRLTSYLHQLKKVALSKNILVYCWRGGLRSSSMAWLFNLAGYNAKTLMGGYRSYRRYAQQYFSTPYRFIILGGMTGSGKTELLEQLKSINEQVVNLEALANHKGSAFGWIGQPPQPTTEHFENLLFEELLKLDPLKPIWIEDESSSIGTIFIPPALYTRMGKCPTIAIEVDREVRIARLAEEYARFSADDLVLSVTRMTKRMGGDRAKQCIDYIRAGNFKEAIAITLSYYDKTYSYGLTRKAAPPISIKATNNNKINLGLLLAAKNSIGQNCWPTD